MKKERKYIELVKMTDPEVSVALSKRKQSVVLDDDDAFPLDDVKEQIVNAVGGFGKWQLKKSLFIVSVIWVPAACHLLNMVFFRWERKMAAVVLS